MMCQQKFIGCNKCGGSVDRRGGCSCVKSGVHENSVFPTWFYYEHKIALKKKIKSIKNKENWPILQFLPSGLWDKRQGQIEPAHLGRLRILTAPSASTHGSYPPRRIVVISLDSDSHSKLLRPSFLFLVSLYSIFSSPFLPGYPSDSGFSWMVFLTSVLVPTRVSTSLFFHPTPPGFCPSSRCLRPAKSIAPAPDNPTEAHLWQLSQ